MHNIGQQASLQYHLQDSRKAPCSAAAPASALAGFHPFLTFCRICLGVSSRRSIKDASRMGACCGAGVVGGAVGVPVRRHAQGNT